jgi:AcrR family transcriptional regulator
MPPRPRIAAPSSGATRLRARVSTAIRRAAWQELARVGYRGLAMEEVARRAGVGKAALYRRWPSKRAMTADLVADWGDVSAVADTGSLAEDLRAFLRATRAWLRTPQVARVFPDLIAEGRRDVQLAAVLRGGLQRRRREVGLELLARAKARGELPADVDEPLALDLLAAPLYWRTIVTAGDTSDAYIDRLALVLANALRTTTGTGM